MLKHHLKHRKFLHSPHLQQHAQIFQDNSACPHLSSQQLHTPLLTHQRVQLHAHMPHLQATHQPQLSDYHGNREFDVPVYQQFQPFLELISYVFKVLLPVQYGPAVQVNLPSVLVAPYLDHLKAHCQGLDGFP